MTRRARPFFQGGTIDGGQRYLFCAAGPIARNVPTEPAGRPRYFVPVLHRSTIDE
jgi:hypothetical protein